MKCSALALTVAVATVAGCNSLPTISRHTCGNHIVEDGEECDVADDAKCAPPRDPDACHRHCDGNAGCPNGEICAASGYCHAATNVCGNHVVEDGDHEECDEADPGCGAPGTGARSCRYLCDGGRACPVGGSCGNDGICRFATNSYTLGPVVGTGADEFGVLDLDGDGHPDLVARQPGRTVLWRNDGSGAFSEWAAGPMHGWPRAHSLPGVARSPLPASSPLWAAASTQGLELFTLEPPGRLVPLGGAAALLPPSAPTSQTFLGMVRRDSISPFEALYYDADSSLLVTYPIPSDYAGGSTMAVKAAFDLSACGLPGAVTWSQVVTMGKDPSNIIVQLGQMGFCALVANGNGNWTAQKLKLPNMPAGGFGWRAFVGDVDGNHEADVVVMTLSRVGSPVFFVYLAQGGVFAPPVSLTIQGDLPVAHATTMADINGDGRDDFVIDGTILANHTGGSGATFDVGRGFVMLDKNPQVLAFGPIERNLAGDLNKDGFADLVLTNTDSANNLQVCLGDGTGSRFTCALESTGVTNPADVLLADVNADGVNDIVVVTSSAGAAATGPDQPGLAVLLGRPFALPDSNALPLHVYRDRLGKTVAAPSVSVIASDLFAAIHTSDGRDGLAVARGDPQALAFSWPFAAVADVRMLDDDGDGVPDVAVLQHDRITLLHSDGNGGLAGGMELVRGPFPGNYESQVRFATLGGDPLAVVGWDASSIWTLRSVAGVLQSTVANYATLNAPVLLDRDLDGDGHNELFVFDAAPFGSVPGECAVYIGRFPDDGAATMTPTPGLMGCAPNVLALVDVPPLDGKLDLVVQLAAHDGPVVLRQLEGDVFDVAHPEPVPAIFHDGAATLGYQSTWSWIDTVDVNGDGLDDLIVRTLLGAQVALADVRVR